MDAWTNETARGLVDKIADGLVKGTVQCNHSPQEIARGTLTDLNFHIEPGYANTFKDFAGRAAGAGTSR